VTPFAVVDTGALVAAAVESDPQHRAVRDVLISRALEYVIPAMCVAEASYLIERDLGPAREAVFLDGLAGSLVLAPEGDDWRLIAQLVSGYADFPLGGTDASVVALCERLDTDLILTLDHRHFRAIKPRHCEFFRLLPEL
jgi:predicted nucleic acid-binding protein